MLPNSSDWFWLLGRAHPLWFVMTIGIPRGTTRITSRRTQDESYKHVVQAEILPYREGRKHEALTCHSHEATCQYFYTEIFSIPAELFWGLIFFSSKCQHLIHIMSIFQPFYSKLHPIKMYVYLLYFSILAVFSIRNYGKKLRCVRIYRL